jgi:hypothetical protein
MRLPRLSPQRTTGDPLIAVHAARIASADADAGYAGVVFPACRCQHRASDAPSPELLHLGLHARARDGLKREPDLDRGHPVPREWDEAFADPERLPSTDTLLGPSPISQLCRCDSDHDGVSPATGFPQRARSPGTQPTQIGHASLDLPSSFEICNTNTTCEHICEPRIPASDRADCPTCHAAAMTGLRRRLRRGPHDPLSPNRLPDSVKDHLRGEGPHGPKEPESRGRTRRRFPTRELLPSLPSSPIRAVQDWDVSAWRRTGLGPRSTTSPRRAVTLRKPGSFPPVEIHASHGGSLRVCAGTGLLLPRPLRATSEESLRLWNRRSDPR